MQPACLVRFHPSGPWRFGPDSGERDRVERVLHSDALFSAVSWAMASLGVIEDWLDATARREGGPAVRFSSVFPFQADLLFVIPPNSVWPPLSSLKIRWKGARFLPFAAIQSLLVERALDEETWRVDGLSQCLLPASWEQGPLRQALRSNAAIDRLSGAVAVHRTACLEFASGAGVWAVAAFADEDARAQWLGPVQAALRLLGDSGLGGERSQGWGRSQSVEFVEGALPDLLWKGGSTVPSEAGEDTPQPSLTGNWLLSVFSPAESDRVDWSRGDYSLVERRGRMEGAAAQGAAKKTTRMVAEGSVLLCDGTPAGAALDAAPEQAPHPAYRAGFALSLPIPMREASR